MPNLTISISEDLKRQIDSMADVNWSEVVREFLSKKVKREAFLKEVGRMLESEEEKELVKWSVELGRKAKKGRFERLLKELSPEARKKLGY